MRMKVVLEIAEEGGYTAFVPPLPGCVSEGETEEEVLANIKEAIMLYLDPIGDEMAAPVKGVIREVNV